MYCPIPGQLNRQLLHSPNHNYSTSNRRFTQTLPLGTNRLTVITPDAEYCMMSFKDTTAIPSKTNPNPNRNVSGFYHMATSTTILIEILSQQEIDDKTSGYSRVMHYG